MQQQQGGFEGRGGGGGRKKERIEQNTNLRRWAICITVFQMVVHCIVRLEPILHLSEVLFDSFSLLSVFLFFQRISIFGFRFS